MNSRPSCLGKSAPGKHALMVKSKLFGPHLAEKKTLPFLKIAKFGTKLSKRSVALSVVSHVANWNNPEFKEKANCLTFEE